MAAIKTRTVTKPDGTTTRVKIGSKADAKYGGSSESSSNKSSSSSGIDSTYNLRPGESTADYTKRIDAYRMSDANPLKITSSSGTERADEAKMGKEILTYSAPSYTSPANNDKYLRDMERFITQAESERLSGIRADYDQQLTETRDAQKKEVGATGTTLARLGGYLGESASGMGVMQNLVTGHRAEVASLESRRQQAVSEAREFYAQKRFDLAKERLQEAKDREQEIYNRQQDFFTNQRLVAQDERTILNQERDDARAVLTNIISNANGQSFDELDEDTQAAIEEAAAKAGYPLGVIQSMLEKPKALATKLDSLIRDAAKYGAPASILAAIGDADSYTEAATIAAPYLAKASSGKDGDGSGGVPAKFVPSSLQGVVAAQGTNQTLEDLLRPNAPGWFYPVASEVAQTSYEQLGLAGPVADPDPNGWIVAKVWDGYRTQPEVQLFVQEMRKKIIGSPKDPEADSGYGSFASGTDTSTDITE